MSFQQGLSGLNAASKSLDAIGNNVANASTVGFKGGIASFADVYAASLAGATAASAGLGTKLAGVTQQFTQGNISVTNNPLDLAINGRGFFRMSDSGVISYTRNGQFQLNKDGYIVDSTGKRLTGYGTQQVIDPTSGLLVDGPNAGDELDLRIDPTSQGQPAATGNTGDAGGLAIGLNLDSRAAVPSIPFTSTLASPTPSAASYNSATSATVYDSLGNAHTQTMYFRKVTPPPGATQSLWDMYISVDGTQTSNVAVNGVANGAPSSGPVVLGASQPIRLAFGSDGALENYILNPNAAAPALSTVLGASTPPSLTINLNQVATDLGKSNIATIGNNTATLPVAGPPAIPAIPINTFTFSLAGSTQFGADFSVSEVRQDGFPPGRLSGFSVAPDGALQARFDNGQTDTVGFVRLTSFVNPQGLSSAGNNQWVQTASSGAPVDGTPGAGSMGVLQSAALEDSNVDLTAELVSMITAQRIYQANAQTIKTQDGVLQTLVNLR